MAATAHDGSSNPLHASRDDEASTSAAPIRYAESSSSASASASASASVTSSPSNVLVFSRPSPLASAASSMSGHGGGGDSLRRPAMPSWTPMTSQAANASMASIHSAEASDGAATTHSHLSRAKSISSVTSVTSTSSMEAVPFRNAPMGNIRMGYSWGNRPGATATGRVTMPASAGPTPTIPQRDFETGAQQAAAAAAAAEAAGPSTGQAPHTAPSTPLLPGVSINEAGVSPRAQRQRGLNPKTAEDGWQYRNAPGLGGRLDGKPLPGSHRNLRDLAASSSSQLEDTSPPKRPAQNLRSKLVKSASKLGLKPLTVSSAPGSGPSSLSSSVDLRGEPLPGTPELFTPTKTSAVTNAPLVVPKLSPAPGGSPFFLGTSPSHDPASPLDGGSGLLPWPSPLLTPTRLGETEGPVAGSSSRPGSRNSNRRVRKATSVQGPAGGAAAAGEAQKTSPTSRLAGRDRTSLSSPTPGPTPAEIVMLEAQAGVAKLPTEPSGSMPGPTPIAPSGDEMPRPKSLLAPTDDEAEEVASNRSQKSPNPGASAEATALNAYRWESAQGTSKTDYNAPPLSSPASPQRPSPGASAAPFPFPLARPPPMLRFESSATNASHAVSDASGSIAPAAFKRPDPKVVAGKQSIPEIRPELINGSPVGSEPRLSTDEQRLAPAGPHHGSAAALSVLSERSDERGTSPVGGSSAGGMSPRGTSPMDRSVTPLVGSVSTIATTTTGPPQPAVQQQQAQAPAHSHPPGSKSRGRDDFEFGDILGEGSYSTVMLAWDLLSGLSEGESKPKPATSAAAAMSGSGSRARQSMLEGKKAYAIKVLDKVHILKERKQKYVAVEKEALSALVRHPGVVTLYWTFQDKESLYFVLELAPNGELLTYIKRHGSFDVATTRYYAAQLVDVLEGMHAAGVIHRDLKPENVLLDAEMRVKVTDFGSAKIMPKSSSPTTEQSQSRTRTSSFVGTAEYVSPELLTSKAASPSSDFWALGCVIFQMLCGRPPFKASSEYQTFQKIIKREVEMPDELGEVERNLLDKLLVLDPEERLGSKGVEEVKKHAFFEGVEWDKLWTVPAPEMKTGIKEPAPAPSTSKRPTDEEDSMDVFGHDGWASGDLADESNDEQVEMLDKSTDDRAVPTGAAVAPTSPSSALSSPVDADADADASSLSEVDVPAPPPRKRGQSVGERTAERFAAIRRGSSLLKMPTIPSESKAPTPAMVAAMPAASSRARFTLGAGNGSSSSIEGAAAPPRSTYHRPSGSGGGSSLGASVGSSAGVSPATSTAPSTTLNWGALLLPSESLLYASIVVHKKTGTANLQSKRRMLLLTDFPRLLCVKEDAVSLSVKSEVLLAQPGAAGGGSSAAINGGGDAVAAASSPNVMQSVEQKGTRSFVVHTPGKSHYYDDPSGDATNWVKSIRRAASVGVGASASAK